MGAVIGNFLSALEFGEPQRFKSVGIIPLFCSAANHGPEYLTLKEAMGKKLIIITEVSPDGSVPELKAINKAEVPILLLDGEEITGAKQNRTLNTTILLKENSEIIIPVSCTERGRWSYTSSEFRDSDLVMPSFLRAEKNYSVADSLKESNAFRTDQGAIWNGIDEIIEEAGVDSSTSAMRDVYESKVNYLNECLETFKCMPSQKGLLAFIDGKVAGFDFVSLESAYKSLHPKLVKSYVMDAVLRDKKKKDGLSLDKAKAFIKEAALCNESRYESIGYGWDYRFEGSTVIGSALVNQDVVIHAAFFRAGEDDRVGEISSFKCRRGYRL